MTTGENPFLHRAARLALRAAGDVEPNPLVGAIIERDGRVLGMGHHRVFGGAHAEREALADAARRGEDVRGATMHVTLEPCPHHGKQPPCVDAILEARLAKVVFARHDPGEQSGRGAEKLREAGVEAAADTSCPLATHLSDPFVHTTTTGRPWVTAKWAQTIDGRIATRTGESKWISGAGARRRVHRLRARVDAILTGLGTILADDPMLTARDVRRVRRSAHRIVLDPELDTPADAAVVRTARDVPTLIACGKELATSDIAAQRRSAFELAGARLLGVPEVRDRPGALRIEMLMETLSQQLGVTNLLVEAGGVLLGSLFEADLVCEAVVYVAPLLLGDADAVAAAHGRVAERLDHGRRFDLCRVRRVGDDVELTYRRPLISDQPRP